MKAIQEIDFPYRDLKSILFEAKFDNCFFETHMHGETSLIGKFKI
jgi:hypothetical protein